MFLRPSLFVSLLVLCLAPALSQQPESLERSRGNFMVVVRESAGANRPDDQLVPTGKMVAKLPDGREVELDFAHWDFIGDTHIRFVFDLPASMINATPLDLERLGVKNVEQALELALANVRRTYGVPTAKPFAGGVQRVQGSSPDFDSSYFLDRRFWNEQLKNHPEGIVVSVAARGELLFAPLSDVKAVEGLKRSVARRHSNSQRLRVSSALFLFKEGKWSVFQPPVVQ